MATKKITRKSKKATNKFDFSDSVKAIQSSAKTVNKEIREVAEEVTEDIKENGGQLREVAVATVKKAYNEAYDKITDTVNVENITKLVKEANSYTLKTADELVDGAIENSEKWQGVANKAVKGSLKLAAKQQDIVFDTLDSMKGQLTKSAKRFKKLFSNN